MPRKGAQSLFFPILVVLCSLGLHARPDAGMLNRPNDRSVASAPYAGANEVASQLCSAPGDSLRFPCSELLTRPTATSVTVNACASEPLEVYFEYGPDSANYARRTATVACPDSVPFTFLLDGLAPDAVYFYRMRYRPTGAATFAARPSHLFHTRRTAGRAFTFAVEADPHMDTNSVAAVYARTLRNVAERGADFLLDLGDTFMTEKLADRSQPRITMRNLLLRSFLDAVCHSIPLYLVQGNHDGELGWLLDGTANSLPVLSANTRKAYYPNPEPDGFYSGNAHAEPSVGRRQNYYAWEWGNALFVVIDPYWYTKSKPGWGWTLGADQYDWFRNILSSSRATFKFVFCHQLVGGSGNDARGGAEFVSFWEMGGRNADSTWGFDTCRPGWPKPVHQLLIDNKVDVYFHGHDHFYGKQDKDGVVYQEVPQPSLKSYTNMQAANYGYMSGVLLPNRGYLLVSVTDTSATVEYIRTYLPPEENAQRRNGDVSHVYTIRKSGSAAAVQEEERPDAFALGQNYPNPFAGSTTLPFRVGTAGRVTIEVFDMLGRNVATIVNGDYAPGSYSVRLDGASLPSGIYCCRIRAAGRCAIRSMIHLPGT